MEDVARSAGSPWRWVPAVLYAAAIFVASSVPGNQVPHLDVSDKVAHFFLFAGFGAVALFAFRRFVPTVATAALYGVIDEIHQRFTPGRDASALDALADLLGAAAGAALVLVALHLWRLRRPARGHRP